MSITINPTDVSKLANSRPEEDSAEAKAYDAPVKKLGSRVTRGQSEVIASVLTPAVQRKLIGSNELVNALRRYADTGEKSAISGEQSEELKKVVTQARERVDNPSKARRIWPRKTAAVLVGIASASDKSE